MSEFVLQPNNSSRYEYVLNDFEKDKIASIKNFVNFSIDKDGFYCTYTKANKFVEQKERYITLFEALNNIPGK